MLKLICSKELFLVYDEHGLLCKYITAKNITVKSVVTLLYAHALGTILLLIFNQASIESAESGKGYSQKNGYIFNCIYIVPSQYTVKPKCPHI